ncbi:MAG TPA: hypothetical protein VJ397_06750 [Thermoplasmata archaeon]|nr:hypothetical protein [Thermoplasmata archaeon]
MPTPQDVYDRILGDMRSIWGDVADFMLKKRLTDVHSERARLSKDELVRIVQLLREKTLPATLGREGAERKALRYLSWVKEIA